MGVETPEFPPENDRASPSRRGHHNNATRARATELNHQRLAHARGQGPEPEAQPINPAALNQVTAALQ